MRKDQWDDARDEIVQRASRLADGANAGEAQFERAADAGAALAAEVYRYRQDPESVGLDALEAAYQRFMQLHAGNFTALETNNA